MLESSIDPETQTSEDQILISSMMTDTEQDFTNDLKNVMKIEKLESSLHSETLEITSTGQTFEEFLAEGKERQKQMVNWNEENILMQDMHARNTPNKDYSAENSKSEAHNCSYNNRNQQLVFAEKKNDQFQRSIEIFSTLSKICNKIYSVTPHCLQNEDIVPISNQVSVPTLKCQKDAD
nr:zinc finger protein 85-like [Biomphalaria glabrata]